MLSLIYNFLKKNNHTYFILNQLNEPQIRVLGVRTGSQFTFPGLGAVERYELKVGVLHKSEFS